MSDILMVQYWYQMYLGTEQVCPEGARRVHKGVLWDHKVIKTNGCMGYECTMKVL